MALSFRITLVAVGSALALSACSGGGKGGPDEFNLLNTKPLELPESYDVLPTPNPGGINRVDKVPEDDAIAALGGNANVLERAGLTQGEQTLLGAALRYGVDPSIRKTLTKADKARLKSSGARVLERLVGQKDSERAYQDFELDQNAEAARLRALGIKAPVYPTEPPDRSE